jgi:subtilisin family serine protease
LVRKLIVVLAAAALCLGAAALTTSAASGAATGSYVVLFRDGVDAATKIGELERAHGFRAEHQYAASIAGFAASLAPQQRERIARDPSVASLHEDRPLRLVRPSRAQSVVTTATGVRRIGGGTKPAKGVAVAVLDTGIDLSHPDIAALAGTNCTGGAGRRASAVADGHGHGTHVAGTIAGKNGIGVAPGTTVYAVKVLDDEGRGTTSALICGIEWVTANAAKLDIRVASLSLGGPGTPDADCGRSTRDVLHKAICRASDAGVLFVVAAGNDATDLAGYVPAGYPEVLAVAAMADVDGAAGGRGGVTTCGARERDDTAASFSNYAGDAAGAMHVIAAPGVCIRSAWPGGGYRTISGTSMAAPHVAATAALCIASGRCRGAAPAIIRQLRSDAAAHGPGFSGDERSVLLRRHLGDLVWAGAY